MRQRDDHYAHEALRTPPFDGLLVSKAIVDGLPGATGKYTVAQRQRLYRVGVRSFFRLDHEAGPRIDTLGDCGAFTYVRDEVPPYTPDEVIDFYDGCGFDLGISIDHVILGYDPAADDDPAHPNRDDWQRRQEITLYSGMLTVVTGVDSLKSITPTRQIRVVTIGVLAVASLIMSLLLTNATTALNTALLIMLYVLAPWTAVNLTDYFFVRRGHYAIADLFTPTGIYGAWSWRGLTAFLVAIAAEIPFVDLPFFVGPAATAMGEVDIAFIVGLLVSGVVYLVLTRSLDVSHELALIDADPSLADPASVEDITDTIASEERVTSNPKPGH